MRHNLYSFDEENDIVHIATVDSIIALQYRAKNIPVTQPATVIASALSSPEA